MVGMGMEPNIYLSWASVNIKSCTENVDVVFWTWMGQKQTFKSPDFKVALHYSLGGYQVPVVEFSLYIVVRDSVLIEVSFVSVK